MLAGPELERSEERNAEFVSRVVPASSALVRWLPVVSPVLIRTVRPAGGRVWCAFLLASPLAVLGACDVDAPTDEARFSYVSGSIAAGDVVSRDPEITLTFERAIAPENVEDVRIVSGGRRYSVRAYGDPFARSIVFEPTTRLEPRADHRLVLGALRSTDGALLEEVDEIPFRTDATTEEHLEPRVDVPAVLTYLRDACARCHGGDAPISGLDLATAAGVRRTAISVAARAVAIPRGATPVGLDGLDLVSPGRPERSYLLYVIAGDAAIRGEVMPPEGPPPDADTARLLVDWVRAGAPLE